MTLRVVGFILIAVAVIGFFITLGTLDNRMASLIGAGTRGFFYVMSQGRAFGDSVPMGPLMGAHTAAALLGLGLIIFGKRRQ